MFDDVENETAPRVEQYLSKIKVIRRIAQKIIDFLAQLEDFQKKLWLKKKFVVSSHYCITLDRVPEALWPEVVANAEQWVRWKQLGVWDGDAPGTVDDLKVAPYRMVDTSLFDAEIVNKLVAHIEGQFDALDDGGRTVDLVVEEDLPHADAQDGAVDGGQAVKLPVLGEVALDGLVDGVELLGGAGDDVAGVGGDGGDAFVETREFDAVLDDGDGVDVAGLRLEEDVDGAAARTIARAVAAPVAVVVLLLAEAGLIGGVGQVLRPSC